MTSRTQRKEWKRVCTAHNEREAYSTSGILCIIFERWFSSLRPYCLWYKRLFFLQNRRAIDFVTDQKLESFPDISPANKAKKVVR